MTSEIIVYTSLVVLIIVFLFSAIWLRKIRPTRVPNYRALFIIGLAWLPLGIIFQNNVFLGVGAIFFITGLSNKKKWDQYRKWKALSPQEKKVKLTMLILSIIILIISILAFLYTKAI